MALSRPLHKCLSSSQYICETAFRLREVLVLLKRSSTALLLRAHCCCFEVLHLGILLSHSLDQAQAVRRAGLVLRPVIALICIFGEALEEAGMDLCTASSGYASALAPLYASKARTSRLRRNSLASKTFSEIRGTYRRMSICQSNRVLTALFLACNIGMLLDTK